MPALATTRRQRRRLASMAPLALLSALLLLQGVRSAGAPSSGEAAEYLDKCCGLGNDWGGQKLRCERFTGPVAGVPRDEQAACLEAVDICCRKSFQERDCEQGKADARAGLECSRLETGARRTPVGFGDFRRDCCEGCKLGMMTGSSGKSCSSRKLVFGIPWEPSFVECCNEAKTTTAQDSTKSTTPAKSTSTSTVSTTAETDEFDIDDLDDVTDPTLSTSFDSGDLCKIMKGLLCTDICVPTPGSYYCKCNPGSTLQADGRTCKSNVTTTAATKKTTLLSTTLKITKKPTTAAPKKKTTTKKPTSTTKKSVATTAAKSTTADVKTTKPMSPLSTLKAMTSKLRTTRSASTEDNELVLCPLGYRWSASSESCDDVDECSEELASCENGTHCVNTNGSYRCVEASRACELGYSWNATAEQCVDVDECLENTHKCLVDSESCKNLEGSYECEIKCDAGYVFNGNFGACLDVNECIELESPCPEADAVCVNKLGGYLCIGPADYAGEPEANRTAEEERRPTNERATTTSGYEVQVEEGDIDECELQQQACAPGEICRNTIGGYDCMPAGCPRGFVLANELCLDVDECAENSHACAPEERCRNTNGSYTCEPPRPTRRPSTTEPPRIICRKGYKGDAMTNNCVDIDECVEGPGCRDHERCVNLIGSYDCYPLCGPGWYFQMQTKTCQDVDECLLGRHNCRQRTQYCVNTNGSYACEPLEACGSGYRRSQTGSCVDIDECQESLHTCSRDSHRYCVNREGGYECITRLPSCSRGFEYSLFTRQCEDVDECRRQWARCNATLNERCVNLPGSYRCERPVPSVRLKLRRPACPAGFSYDVALRQCSSGKAGAAAATTRRTTSSVGTSTTTTTTTTTRLS